MSRIQGILFDLGNTLLDFGRVDTVGLFRQGARLAYSYLRELNQPLPAFRKFHRTQLWAVRWRYFLSRVIHREFDSLDVLAGISRSMGQSLTGEQMEELAWRWYVPLSKCAALEDCLPAVLEQFRRDGLALAVVSNTFVPGQVLDRHLADVGLLQYFETRVYSCDVRYRKPDRRIFQIAMERVGVAPEQAMFVGDSLKADVAGARKAGMISVLKDPTGAKRRRWIRPAHRIASLAELPDIVAAYNGQTVNGGQPAG